MKTTKLRVILSLVLMGSAFAACQRTSNDVWEDSRSGGRHLARGVKSFAGKNSSSRAIQDPDSFYVCDDNNVAFTPAPQPMQNDFVPLADAPQQGSMGMNDVASRPPTETPGDPGSSIPGIDAFKDPATMPEFAKVFQNIYFDYNSFLIKGQENVDTLRAISNYMTAHPRIYVFVEGHTDERGPEAFNLSLGARRANAVRNELIQNGVHPDNIFTISYGKERPVVLDHHEEAWTKNRRAEFKIYQK